MSLGARDWRLEIGDAQRLFEIQSRHIEETGDQ